jgi:hypothetical protein
VLTGESQLKTTEMKRRANGTGSLLKPHATADWWARSRKTGGGFAYVSLGTIDKQEALTRMDSDIVQDNLRRLRQQ